jgi:hypothetical protein
MDDLRAQAANNSIVDIWKYQMCLAEIARRKASVPQISEPLATVSREGDNVGNAKLYPPLAEPKPAFIVPSIVDEKMKAYRERLKIYANDILPKQGGMMPSEGIGGVTMKLRKFALLQVGATDTTAFTEDQWQMLFEFLDGHLKQFGAKELAIYIDKSIGATK